MWLVLGMCMCCIVGVVCCSLVMLLLCIMLLCLVVISSDGMVSCVVFVWKLLVWKFLYDVCIVCLL